MFQQLFVLYFSRFVHENDHQQGDLVWGNWSEIPRRWMARSKVQSGGVIYITIDVNAFRHVTATGEIIIPDTVGIRVR